MSLDRCHRSLTQLIGLSRFTQWIFTAVTPLNFKTSRTTKITLHYFVFTALRALLIVDCQDVLFLHQGCVVLGIFFNRLYSRSSGTYFVFFF